MRNESTDRYPFNRIGERIAQDLREQAARRSGDAARAAGCATEDDVRAWVDRHRPGAQTQTSAAA